MGRRGCLVTPACAKGLFQNLSLGISPRSAQGTICVPAIKLRMVLCKASTQSTVIFILHNLKGILNRHFTE